MHDRFDEDGDPIETDGMDMDVADEAKTAMYRATAKQIAKTVRKPLLAAFKKEGASSGQLKMLADFLATDRGLALLSIFLGFAVTLLPQAAPGKSAVVRRLAVQLRVGGMQQFADDIADVIGEPLRQALGPAVKKLAALEDGEQD